MPARKYVATGAQALTVAELLVQKLGWIFRRQPESDFGIDAQIEIVAEKKPTGRLIAAQIKGGPSYFKSTTEDGYVFYIDSDHFEYWVNFSLPVVIVLVDVASEKAYWQLVSEETVVKTEKGWKIVVPFGNLIEASATDAFLAIGDVPEPVRRFAELTLAHVWMRYLADGKRLFVEVEEWINKSSGRGALRLIVEDDQSGEQQLVLTWPLMFLGSLSFEQAVRDFFPWANVDVDEELYEESATARWIEDNGMWDSEEGRYWYDETQLEEYLKNRREYSHYAELEPYDDNGEVAKYRFELTLNDIGRGFLAVAGYLYYSHTSVRAAIPGGVPTRARRSRRR